MPAGLGPTGLGHGARRWLASAITVLVSLLLSVLCLAAPASAKPTCSDADLGRSMRAVSETVNSVRVLALVGKIEHADKNGRGGSADAVSSAIRAVRNYDEIWLCSGGGSVDQGQKIGKLLASVRAKVYVPEGFLCASSCTIASLGGYLRIIHPAAHFIIHASSDVKNFDPEKDYLYACSKVRSRQDCLTLSSALTGSGLARCPEFEDFQSATNPCVYFSTNAGAETYVGLKLDPFMNAPIKSDVIAAFINLWSGEQVVRLTDLVQYYQSMLNDGNASVISQSGYNAAMSQMRLQQVYGPDGWRSIARDVGELYAATSVDDRNATWHKIFVEVEFQGQKDYAASVNSRASSFGRGGEAALRLLQAMTTCRIQNACELDMNTLRSLGFHNFDAAQPVAP